MLKLHPRMLKRDGRNQFVVLPYEEFEASQKRLLDADDLLALRRARRADRRSRKGLTLGELKSKLPRPTKPRRTRSSRT